MKNPSQNDQGTRDKNAETKKQSGQPTYGDKPWQNPQYGQDDVQKDSQNDSEKDPQGDSCGCGSDSGKTNKKEQTTKRH